MSKMRAIRAALKRVLGETARDAGAGAAGAGATTAAAGRDRGEIARNTALGALAGAGSGRAARSIFRRTGNAGTISSVRRSGRGMMPKGGSKRMARAAEGRAKKTDEVIRHNQRINSTTQYTTDKAAEGYRRNQDRLIDNAGKDRETAAKLRARAKRRRTGNAGPMSSVRRRTRRDDGAY